MSDCIETMLYNVKTLFYNVNILTYTVKHWSIGINLLLNQYKFNVYMYWNA